MNNFNSKWVAYDHTGDLIVSADSEDALWSILSDYGWHVDEVYVGRVSA